MAKPAARWKPEDPLRATPPPVGATRTLFWPRKLKVPFTELRRRLPSDTGMALTAEGPGAETACLTLANWMLAVPDARSKTTGPWWSFSTSEPPKGWVCTA